MPTDPKSISTDPKSPKSNSRAPQPETARAPEPETASQAKPETHRLNGHGFSGFAARVSSAMGAGPAFLAAIIVIVVWAVTGPYFHFSDAWQLVINTSTTIITFLMVFLIQNTQNRDARALHLKLDEVIRALHTAHNEMIDIERLSDQELEHLTKHYEKIREASERRRLAGSQTVRGRGEGGEEEVAGRGEEPSRQKKAS